ncbi:MAG: hypothetical protein WCT77_08595 [Bacteroidota bacterium]
MEEVRITNPVLIVTVSGKIIVSQKPEYVTVFYYNAIDNTSQFVIELKHMVEPELSTKIKQMILVLSQSFKIVKYEHYKDGLTVSKPAIKFRF